MSRVHCYIIAGEPSGDQLGASLMTALKEQIPDISFFGVGGPQMAQLGFKSLFPMQDIALMGFTEIIPHLPMLMKRIKQTVEDVEEIQPDLVITIDSPGFCKRVIAKLQDVRKQGTKCIHYVAPTVWAYRPQRAARFAELYDAILCLLPFEPPYFTEAGMRAEFVGHSVIEQELSGDGPAFRARHGIAQDVPLLCLMPGSRVNEQRRHMLPMRLTCERLQQHYGHTKLEVVALAYPGLTERLAGQKGMHNMWCKLIPFEEKADMLAASTVALSKSGTVTLELALAGIPMVSMFKASPISVMMIRRMVNTRFGNIVNILAGYEVIPEVLQELCRDTILAQELHRLIDSPEAAERQVHEAQHYLRQLVPADGQKPSQKAAQAVASILEIETEAHPHAA